MLDGVTQCYGSCILWQCERHRKERPRFLWCPRCCGPGEIRTSQMHIHTDAHTHTDKYTPMDTQMTTAIHTACIITPPSCLPPADQCTRGLALNNSASMSHILVCSFRISPLPCVASVGVDCNFNPIVWDQDHSCLDGFRICAMKDIFSQARYIRKTQEKNIESLPKQKNVQALNFTNISADYLIH